MTRRPERPRLTPHRESIVPDPVPSTPAAADPADSSPEVKTSTLSLRVPTPVFDRVQREIRRLHFETGKPKGEIATALLEHALSNIDSIQESLSAS
jgi:hypothetical protein